MFKSFQVDEGAIKFVLNGANIMCQGFTSEGGKIVEAKIGEVIVINAEGKENALAIGRLVKSSIEIQEQNSDVGVESLHYLNDDLWKLRDFKKSNN